MLLLHFYRDLFNGKLLLLLNYLKLILLFNDVKLFLYHKDFFFDFNRNSHNRSGLYHRLWLLNTFRLLYFFCLGNGPWNCLPSDDGCCIFPDNLWLWTWRPLYVQALHSEAGLLRFDDALEVWLHSTVKDV